MTTVEKALRSTLGPNNKDSSCPNEMADFLMMIEEKFEMNSSFPVIISLRMQDILDDKPIAGILEGLASMKLKITNTSRSEDRFIVKGVASMETIKEILELPASIRSEGQIVRVTTHLPKHSKITANGVPVEVLEDEDLLTKFLGILDPRNTPVVTARPSLTLAKGRAGQLIMVYNKKPSILGKRNKISFTTPCNHLLILAGARTPRSHAGRPAHESQQTQNNKETYLSVAKGNTTQRVALEQKANQNIQTMFKHVQNQKTADNNKKKPKKSYNKEKEDNLVDTKTEDTTKAVNSSVSNTNDLQKEEPNDFRKGNSLEKPSGSNDNITGTPHLTNMDSQSDPNFHLNEIPEEEEKNQAEKTSSPTQKTSADTPGTPLPSRNVEKANNSVPDPKKVPGRAQPPRGSKRNQGDVPPVVKSNGRPPKAKN